MKIGISACLTGYNVRYNGSNKLNKELLKLLEGHELIVICPEFRAGFSIPHKPLEIKDGQVITSDGKFVTEKLNKGSLLCLEKIKDCDFLILKSKSPSCGYKKIYDGTFSNTLTDGNGIFTQLCINNGLKIYTENDLEEIKKELIVSSR